MHELMNMHTVDLFINPGNSSCGDVTCKHKHRPADFDRWFYETFVDTLSLAVGFHLIIEIKLHHYDYGNMITTD